MAKNQLNTIIEKIDDRFDQMDARFKVVNQQFDKMDQKFNKIDERFDKMDQKFNKIDERFDKTDDRFEKVGNQLNRLTIKVFDMDYYLREDLATKTELQETKDQMLTHIDGFIKLHEKVDLELTAMVGRCDRIESQI